MNITNPQNNKIIASTIAGLLLFSASNAMSHSFELEAFDYDEHVVNVLATGDIGQVSELFDKGLEVNANIDGDGTPLIIAVHNGQWELVDYLISKGADVNLESAQDGNPLIAAALKNDVALVEYLHHKGARIDAITRYDETALISASRAGHFEVVKYLVENGADVNLAVQANVRFGKELRSPLNGARTEKIRDYLLKNGARI